MLASPVLSPQPTTHVNIGSQAPTDIGRERHATVDAVGWQSASHRTKPALPPRWHPSREWFSSSASATTVMCSNVKLQSDMSRWISVLLRFSAFASSWIATGKPPSVFSLKPTRDSVLRSGQIAWAMLSSCSCTAFWMRAPPVKVRLFQDRSSSVRSGRDRFKAAANSKPLASWVHAIRGSVQR